MTGVSDLPFRRIASPLRRALCRHRNGGLRQLCARPPRCGAPRRHRRWPALDGDPAGGPHAGMDRQGRASWPKQAGADIIDFNMGCPAKEVTGALSGSALMREPELAARLIEAAVNATIAPVTLKMRLGWDDNRPQCARDRGAGRTAGRQGHHRAWPHPPAILWRQRRLARGGRGQKGGAACR